MKQSKSANYKGKYSRNSSISEGSENNIFCTPKSSAEADRTVNCTIEQHNLNSLQNKTKNIIWRQMKLITAVT
jgi:hypothetical protein